MTTSQFVTKWNGKHVERYDPKNLNQCVDLVLQFVDDVLGLGSLIPLGINPAYDLYNKTHKLSPHVTKIANTPTAVPQAGDIIVWSSKYGPAGHTAIATGKGDDNSFEVFSQNDPIGKPCIIKTYTYTHVLGWLRPKVLTVEEPIMNDQDKKDIESMKNLRKYNSVWYESKNVIEDYEARKLEISKLQSESGVKSKEISGLKADLLVKEKEITALRKAVEVAQNKASADLDHAKTDYEKKIADLTDKNRIDMENLETRYKEEIKKLKENGGTVDVPTETPLTMRFKGKTFNQKWLAIFEILGA